MTRGEKLAVAAFALRQIERGMAYNPGQVALLALKMIEGGDEQAKVTVERSREAEAALVAAAEKRARERGKMARALP